MRLTATPLLKPPPQLLGPHTATNTQAEPGFPTSRRSICKQADSESNLGENGGFDAQARTVNITATRGRGVDGAAAVDDARNDASSTVDTVGNAQSAVCGSADAIRGSSPGAAAGAGRATFAGSGECEREASATVSGRSGCDQQKQELQVSEAVHAESQRAPAHGGGGALKPTMYSGSRKMPAVPTTAAAAGGSPTVADDGQKGEIIAGVVSQQHVGAEADGAHLSDGDNSPCTSTPGDDSRDNGADTIRLEQASPAVPLTAVAGAGREDSNAVIGSSRRHAEPAATGAALSAAAGAPAPTRSIGRRWTTMANYVSDDERYLRADDNGWRRVWQSQGGGDGTFGWMNRVRESGGHGEKSAKGTGGGGTRGAGVVGSGVLGGARKRFKVSFSTDAVDQAAANGHLEVRLLLKWLGVGWGVAQPVVHFKSGMFVLVVPSFSGVLRDISCSKVRDIAQGYPWH